MIDYRYLNLDTNKFVESQLELVEQIGKGGYLRDIPNYKYGQWLIAGRRKPFSALYAIIKCRRLSFK